MSTSRKIAIGCGGCATVALLMLVAFAATLYYGFRTADAAVSPKLDLFLAAIANDAFDTQYDEATTLAYRNAVTRKQHQAIGAAIDLRLGDLQSKSLQSFKLNQNNTTTTLEVVYGAIFTKSTATIFASYEKQEGVWKLNSFRVESPVFDGDKPAGVCPHCGELHSGRAEFCPSCGKALSNEEAGATAGEKDDEATEKTKNESYDASEA